jgi:hypothetical protein
MPKTASSVMGIGCLVSFKFRKNYPRKGAMTERKIGGQAKTSSYDKNKGKKKPFKWSLSNQ